MKKNLLSVLILVLLLVNIAMTTIMMISVTGTNKKTAELVTSISTALSLQLYEPSGSTVSDVPLDATDTYNLADDVVVLLARSTREDGTVDNKQNYIVFKMSLLQNMEHEDYKAMGGAEKIAKQESLIKDTVDRVVSQHTMEECQNDFDSIREEILKEIQKLFGSNFIFRIAVNGVRYN